MIETTLVIGVIVNIALLLRSWWLISEVKQLAKDMEYFNKEHTDRYWEGRHDWEALLKHLELKITRCPSKTVVEKKSTN